MLGGLKIKRNCIFCGSEFGTYSCRVKNSFGLYCSLECRSQHRHLKSMTAKICIQCGDIYLVKKQSISKFCSRECSMVTFHTRRHKTRFYNKRPIFATSPEKRKEQLTKWRANYRKTYIGKAVHRQDSILRKTYGTSSVPSVCKKILAIRRAVNHGNITNVISQISGGKTYAAYF